MKPIRLHKHDREVLSALKVYIDTLEAPCPDIQTLSRKFGINTDKLKKGFRQIYGIPPYQYILQRQLQKAKELLRDTDSPVTDIALELGYEYAGNFSAWFKRATGMRPLEWRYASEGTDMD